MAAHRQVAIDAVTRAPGSQPVKFISFSSAGNFALKVADHMSDIKSGQAFAEEYQNVF